MVRRVCDLENLVNEGPMTRGGLQRYRKKKLKSLYKSRKVNRLYRTGIQEKIHHITKQNNTYVKIIITLTTITRFLIINGLTQERKGQLQRHSTNPRENALSN